MGLTAFGQSPTNDHFTNAIPLYGNSVTFGGYLDSATEEAGEPRPACEDRDPGYRGSVWWSWTATNSTAVVIETVQAPVTNYSSFSAYAGTNVSALTELNCNYLDFRTKRYIRFSATVGTTYHIRAKGNGGTFTMRLAATNAPVILSPPLGRTLAGNSSVMFGVVAAGLPPLKYQWQLGGIALPGETHPILIRHRLAAEHAGGYSVIVSNASGVTTSAVANLVVSPIAPRPLLGAGNPTGSNRFNFTITGEAGRRYQIQATTNLINWAAEESLPPFYGQDRAIVQNTNETSLFSIPRNSSRKFLRASTHLNTEICFAQLEAINFAIKLWAIEAKQVQNSAVVGANVTPYLPKYYVAFPPYPPQLDFVCPSGGIGSTFAVNYGLTTVSNSPTCLIVPATHYLH